MTRAKPAWNDTIAISCPECGEEIECGYNFSKGCKESGEYMYSLGSPAEPPSAEIEFDECPKCGHALDVDGIESEAVEKERERIEDDRSGYGDYLRDQQMDR